MAENRISQAFAYAAHAHAAQVRKGTSIPYISHLMSVSALVIEFGGDEDQAIAGLLHDVVEDCGAEHAELVRARFGDRVADIVLACTDGVEDAGGVKPPWRPRKEAYLSHLRDAADDVLPVSIADKLHNARAIVGDLNDGRDVFAIFSGGYEGTLWYYRSLADIFAARRGEADRAVREFRAVVAEMGAPRFAPAAAAA